MKLSDKLTELRKEKGWSQEDFAEKLDVSRQAISRWENGTALPDAQNILRISKLFNVTSDYLLNDDYEGKASELAVEASAEEPPPVDPLKKHPYWYLISAMGFALLATLTVITVMIARGNEAHSHLDFKIVRENEIAPTCAEEGSYDEVLYCEGCNQELSRTVKILEKHSHTLSDAVIENELAASCSNEGSYDEVIYCTECDEEILRSPKSVAKIAHILASSVKENMVASTCTKEGSYDEVSYCTKCRMPLMRTYRTTKKLAHQYQNKKCVVCNEDQPSEGLVYMPNGNGTCFVSGEACVDENIIIPEYSPSGEKVVQIKAYGFSGNKAKSIRIPGTVTAIGEGAFQDCINLESINLPSKLTMIESYTFYGCEKLKEITIPSGVYYIGMEAFVDCIACERIVIPASVTKIGKFAFRNFSGCDGTVIFEIHKGWRLYDDSGNCVQAIYFENSNATPTQLITFKFADYAWKRK